MTRPEPLPTHPRMAHRVAESQRGRFWGRIAEFVALVVVLAGVLASIAVGVGLAQP